MYVWNCIIVEVEDMKLGFGVQDRSLPFGKGGGGMGLNDFVTSFGSLIWLSLRRTLVRSVILLS